MFNDYVRCRWPLHIFAIDPETEDQNIGDSFSLRREMQLALSVAFTSGRISANNFNRYVRRIEVDIDTIALNRTIIGFSHGDDTFGWRFYPRVQTPPINGNFQNFFRDLLIGGYGPSYTLRRRRLENGIRECVALVIMPSFVPYLDLEITGNWFRLADPKCKALDLKQTMKLSRSVQAIQQFAPQVCDQNAYRPGDVGLMMRKLDQLSHRLPLQAQLVNVPSENTHGGFQVLSTGVTDLAPELNGWYGAPGINPNGETSLFLVGDNFSVDQTRVIVGGLLLDPNCAVSCSTAGRDPASCVCVASSASAQAAASTAAPSSPSATPNPASGATEKLPIPKQETPKKSPSSLPQGNATPSQGAEFTEGIAQAGFRCRPQETRPPVPPSITVINVPGTATARGVQAAVAGAQAAAAGAHAATAGMQAATTGAGSGGSTSSGSSTTTSSGQSGSTGSQNASAGAQGGAAGGTQSGAGSQAAVSGAQAAVAGAQAAVSGAQATVAGAQAAATTSPALTLAYDVPHFQMELLSRQVMRIVIPRGVYSKDGFVDVHIATPYGVSPHLSIPILCDTTQAAAPTYGYAVNQKSNSVAVSYSFTQVGNSYRPKLVEIPQDAKLEFTWDEPTGSALKTVRAVFQFKVGDAMMTIPSDGSGLLLTATDGKFEIKGDALNAFVTAMFDQLAWQGFSPDKKLLPASLESTSIKFTPVSPATPDGKNQPTHAVKEVKVNNTVKFEFQFVLEPRVLPMKLP